VAFVNITDIMTRLKAVQSGKTSVETKRDRWSGKC
jgi:hypothetical protein